MIRQLDDSVGAAGAPLTPRAIVRSLIERRTAHYHFTMKADRDTLLQDIALRLQDRHQPEMVTVDAEQGRIETRKMHELTRPVRLVFGYLRMSKKFMRTC